MTVTKKKKPMKRTIVIMDETTNTLWKKESRKEGKSKSAYCREAINEKAGRKNK